MKGFWEQKYPYILNVVIKFDFHKDGDVSYDAIKGLNKGHALYLARQNWASALWIKPADEVS